MVTWGCHVAMWGGNTGDGESLTPWSPTLPSLHSMQRRVFVAQVGESIDQVCRHLVPGPNISLAHQQGIHNLQAYELI